MKGRGMALSLLTSLHNSSMQVAGVLQNAHQENRDVTLDELQALADHDAHVRAVLGAAIANERSNGK